jgi:hypothetical protein
MARRMTPQPIATYEGPLELCHPVIGNGLLCTYAACVDPVYPPLEVSSPCALVGRPDRRAKTSRFGASLAGS